MARTQRGGGTAFGWNAGGWAGSQIGATLWMVPVGVLALSPHPGLGLGVFGVFLALNAVGWGLWRSRARLSAYAGLQWLLAATTVGVATVAALVNLAPTPPVDLPYAAVAAPLAVMGMLYVIERAARSRGA